MKNLAGLPFSDVDREIRSELTRCGIAIVEGNATDHPEVMATLRGKLGTITFRRNWYYWVASGPVPLHVAELLYDDIVGRTDIRVNGHCGCPAPNTPGGMPEWIDAEGLKLYPERLRPEWERIFGEETEQTVARTGSRFSADPTRDGRPFITCYHIDSELGLYLFAQAIREHVWKERP